MSRVWEGREDERRRGRKKKSWMGGGNHMLAKNMHCSLCCSAYTWVKCSDARKENRSSLQEWDLTLENKVGM